MSNSSQPVQKKRLALFLDGTWNTVSDNTNIWRLRSLFAPMSSDGLEQRAFYSTGLGTKFGERIRGGMFGRGIDTAITSAYEWLIDNYDLHDEIFIFGFSRGAYTARSLSGFISTAGLLKRGAPLGVNQLYKRYRRPDEATIWSLIGKDGDPALSFEEGWMLRYSMAIPIKFIGVFDTVGALGVPFPLWRKIKGTAYPFLNTGLRRHNHNAFHAIAIDEHRYAFRPTLWTNMGAPDAPSREMQRTEQRWFIGAHANVGGGCFDDPLAEFPCQWLMRKANALKLTFGEDVAANSANVTAPISDSFAQFMNGWYRPLRLWTRYHREIGVPPKEEGEGVKTINETIDSSVFSRWQADSKYRPQSLLIWAASKRVDPAEIHNSVQADDPSIVVPD